MVEGLSLDSFRFCLELIESSLGGFSRLTAYLEESVCLRLLLSMELV